MAFFFPLTFEEIEVCNEAVEESGSTGFVVSECAQQCEDAHAALTCYTSTSGDVFTRLVLNVELEPFTTVWMHCALDQLMLRQVTKAITLTWFENNARATNKLRYNNTLGAIDDESSLVRHLREITHEHNLFFDFTCLTV